VGVILTAAQHTVSVIIPAYNVGHCLSKCIDSVFRQTRVPDEIIVVNDGSTDNTGNVIKSYGERIRSIEQENLGQGAARNSGLDVASKDFVAFLDADDYWLPEFLSVTSDFLGVCPDVVAVSTGGEVLSRGGQRRKVPRFLRNPSINTSPRILEDFFGFWARHDHLRTGTVLMRRSVLSEAGGQRPDLRISQDLEYWGYLGTFGRWGFIPRILWVGDSRAAAFRYGWQKRYETRRKLCPSVKSWESRILRRLDDADRDAFAKIRGRVAAGYSHSKVLIGDPGGALEIFRTYEGELPVNIVTRIMRLGCRLGLSGWAAACGIIRLRERTKAASWMS